MLFFFIGIDICGGLCCGDLDWRMCIKAVKVVYEVMGHAEPLTSSQVPSYLTGNALSVCPCTGVRCRAVP